MSNRERNKRRLALIGADGMLARMVRHLTPDVYDLTPLDLPEFDLTDRDLVLSAMESIGPEIIVNCAAYTNVDGCETDEESATAVNGHGPGYLAEAARELGSTLVHISTDYVFDGTKNTPYTEEDAPNPRSAYGRSKLIGESAILRSGLERFFIVRTSWLYGPGGKNFVETIIRLAKEQEELKIIADQVGTPTFTADLAGAIFNLLSLEAARSSPYGLYHFSDEGQCSWYEFSLEIAAQMTRKCLARKAKRILPITTEEYPLPAKRPAYSVFSKKKYKRMSGAAIPDWRDSLAKYFDKSM